jgi:hypothetical protein
MDISIAGLLSEMLRHVERKLGPQGTAEAIAQEFSGIGPNNPLKGMSRRDKVQLIVIVSLYEHCRDEESDLMQKAERTARLVSDAGKLANRFQQEWDNGTLLAIAEPLERFSKNLQEELSLFSTEVGRFFDLMGKKGHKQKTLSNLSLVTASEFICAKTGTHNDEHFAELLQDRSANLNFNQLSGDAIRKKREHLQKKYPGFYKAAQEIARDLSLMKRAKRGPARR